MSQLIKELTPEHKTKLKKLIVNSVKIELSIGVFKTTDNLIDFIINHAVNVVEDGIKKI